MHPKTINNLIFAILVHFTIFRDLPFHHSSISNFYDCNSQSISLEDGMTNILKDSPRQLESSGSKFTGESQLSIKDLLSTNQNGALYDSEPYIPHWKASQSFKSQVLNDPYKALSSGELKNGGLSYSEANFYLSWLQTTYNELISSFEIGHSYNGHPIIAYRIGGKIKQSYLESISSSFKQSNKSSVKLQSFPEILLTALHHARESCSLTTLLYFMTRLLQEASSGDPKALYIINNREVWVVPIINIDGFIDISKYNNLLIRKNRRPTCQAETYNSAAQGVDLNRNYGFNFKAQNNFCQQEYGGLKPFSEPETQSLKCLIEWYINPLPNFTMTGPFKFILHFHSYGDIWTHPYNCCPNLMLDDYTSEILKELDFVSDATFGNAYSTINYLANGEADDWAYHEHKIISLSPEVSEPRDLDPVNSFWPEEPVRSEAHQINYPRIKNVLLKAGLEINFHAIVIDLQKFKDNNSLSSSIQEYIQEMEHENIPYTAFILRLSNTGLNATLQENFPLFIRFGCTNISHPFPPNPSTLGSFVAPEENSSYLLSKDLTDLCSSHSTLHIFYKDNILHPNTYENNNTLLWSVEIPSSLPARSSDDNISPTIETILVFRHKEKPQHPYYFIDICMRDCVTKEQSFCQCGSMKGLLPSQNSSEFHPFDTWLHSHGEIFSSKLEPLCAFDLIGKSSEFIFPSNDIPSRKSTEYFPQHYTADLITIISGLIFVALLLIYFLKNIKINLALRVLLSFTSKLHLREASSKINERQTTEANEEKEEILSRINLS